VIEDVRALNLAEKRVAEPFPAGAIARPLTKEGCGIPYLVAPVRQVALRHATAIHLIGNGMDGNVAQPRPVEPVVELAAGVWVESRLAQ
jgi:hypothetical protein